jgi:Carboxylesterase family/Creatinase/Prolidase N-terminal domain
MPHIAEVEHRERLERLRSEVAGERLERFLVTSFDSIYYLTGAGFEPLERPFFLVLSPPGGEPPTLLVPRLDAEHMKKARAVNNVLAYWDCPSPAGRGWADVLPGLLGAGRRVGVEPSLRLDVAETLCEFSPVVRPLVERLRLVKSASEVAMIRRGACHADRAVEQLLDASYRGATVAEGFARTGTVTRAILREVDDWEPLPVKVLLKAQKRFLRRNELGGDLVFGPVVDGGALPEPPLHAIRRGCARDVALMTGTTLDETRLWSLYVPILRWTRPHALRRVLSHAVGDRWPEVIAAYRRSRPGENAGNLTMAINGDLLFRMPAIRLAEAQSAHRPDDTRIYVFAWRTPVLGGRLGSPHAVDVPFVFGNLTAPGVHLYTGDGDDRAALAALVQDAWIAFARSGDPNHDGLPAWPAYRPDARATLFLGDDTTVEEDPMAAERSIWADVPFDGLRPAIGWCVPSTRELIGSLLSPRPLREP